MKVSVLLTTYNHEKWVAQAIESVLMQQTNFDYEIVIMEDASTDGTRDIAVDYQRRYPEKIRLILSEKNKCDNTNFMTAWRTSRSEYVAVLDGDDYWVSDHKLQKQADYLDTHPGFAVCFHNVTGFSEATKRMLWNYNPPDQKEVSTLEDLWAGNFIAGCSPMLRGGVFGELPEWYATAQWGDWPLLILAAQHGKIGYIDEVMGAYRVHDRGYWSGLSTFEKVAESIKFYYALSANLDLKYKDVVRIQTMIVGYSRILLQMQNERLETGIRQLASLERDLSHAHGEIRRLRKRARRLRSEVGGVERELQELRGSRAFRMIRIIGRLRTKVSGGA
jgi:glycosyltransferase involved in cell wall biosynthesis